MDKNNNNREEFLEFGRWERLSGKIIATDTKGVLEKSNLEEPVRSVKFKIR